MQLQPLTGTHLIWAVGLVLAAYILRFLQRLHFHRTLVNGLPGPPHSYAFGSLISMGKVAAKQPPNAAPQALMQCLKDAYDLPDAFYFDSWPLGPPIMVITNPDMANQITIKYNPPKHPLVAEFMVNFGGKYDLVSEEGAVWKKWRSAFNPGFAPGHLITQVSTIVDECQVFCDIMEKRARNNELFRMEPAATKLTVNIIGKIVLDLDLNAQHGKNVLVDSFMSQIRWQKIGLQYQPSELWDIRRPIIQRYNNWRMHRWLSARLDERFAGLEARGKSKHVIDLALEAYLKEIKGQKGSVDASKIKGLDPDFKEAAISNMKTFTFAGHDTTSSAICYSFYYLSKYPETLAKIRKEHEEIFGPDPDVVAQKLKSDPHLLSKMEYTLAVTKEVLRMQPPASTIRLGQANLTLHNPDTGENMPTNHFMLWPVNVGMHRNPRNWPNPDIFDPERFIPGSAVYAENNKDAWVPFSKGVRNCIGQELAIMEAKVILAMIVRKFDFISAYNELEKLVGDGSSYPNYLSGVREQFGERAYQVQLGTAKPAEGMPCRMKLAKR
ncbi:uncharacterized protein MYCFIDRAFT_167334 [Pseudocercospora fijiensis CIRAD86]|uniref:Uncharacterized protein n=1 Tax=Pseudocercospora fijiensis (strain CIRAD86) TaxID=383855 RepID=M2ZK27_PSEFD|nr:uncharacterized protein MYCFIDRAFT_167334 [Pseudocercospora fijiensis CIRAD86]EME79459.1 hypothetical protein MYCFIDRAFT_167334 [Pseudocercospora fijiensis CIRAD86]